MHDLQHWDVILRQPPQSCSNRAAIGGRKELTSQPSAMSASCRMGIIFVPNQSLTMPQCACSEGCSFRRPSNRTLPCRCTSCMFWPLVASCSGPFLDVHLNLYAGLRIRGFMTRASASSSSPSSTGSSTSSGGGGGSCAVADAAHCMLQGI